MNNKINNKHFYMIFDNGHIVHAENRSNRLVRYFRHLFNLRSNLKLTSFVPKKPYSNKEIKKLSDILYRNHDLDESDIVVIINSIRPNTIRESLTELETSEYYINATAKKDINLLKSGKQI